MTAKPQKTLCKVNSKKKCVFLISLGIQIVKYIAYDFFTEKSFDFEETAR